MKKLFCLSVLILCVLACLPSSATTPIAEPPTQPPAVSIVTPMPSLPTGALKPTDTPIPVEPTVLLELEGVGNVVTDNFEWPACQKAVFYWTSATGQDGSTSLFIHLHKVGTELRKYDYLVHEHEFFVPDEGLSGAALRQLDGGKYFFSTEMTENSWTLRVECQDGQAVEGTGIDIRGVGSVVTGNYELPACQKSVFLWSILPDGDGRVSLNLFLHKIGERDSIFLVDEYETDATEPLAGEALQQLSGGLYCLNTENTRGLQWTVRWECRD